MPNTGTANNLSLFTLKSHCREETFNLGVSFGCEARGGEVIALIGELGAGKTQFVQGLAEGLGIEPSDVNSPTYTLVHEYEGRLSLCHVDLYRLENVDEITGFGLEDYFDGDGVAAIEWADKGEAILPQGRVTLIIRTLEADQRELSFKATDAHHQSWIERVLKKQPNLKRTTNE